MTRRTPSQYNFEKLLFDETILTKHFTPQASKDVRFIVIHHMAMVGQGDGKANDSCYKTWQTRKASAHYGIDGRFIRQFVWDKDYAWATGSTEGNKYGISIEHANSSGKPNWTVSDETFKTSARLVAYLHKMYGIGRPVKNKTIRRHNSFVGTECPGPYLGDKVWDEYAVEVQRIYDEITKPSHPATSPVVVPDKPADLLDLDDWKWTSPEGKEVKQPELSKMKSNKYIYVTADGLWVAFRSYCGGKTTENTHYSRSELRQMIGKALAAWNPKTQDSTIQATYMITAQPEEKPDQVILQAHSGKDDVMQVRHEGKHLFVTINGKFHETLDKNLPMHTKFYLRAISDKKTGLKVRYQRTQSTKIIETKSKKVTAAKLFWKTGEYVQSNVEHGDKPTAFGEVLIYKGSLKVTIN